MVGPTRHINSEHLTFSDIRRDEDQEKRHGMPPFLYFDRLKKPKLV